MPRTYVNYIVIIKSIKRSVITLIHLVTDSKIYCKVCFNIKLVFNSFKTKHYFSIKDPFPNDLSFPNNLSI